MTTTHDLRVGASHLVQEISVHGGLTTSVERYSDPGIGDRAAALDRYNQLLSRAAQNLPKDGRPIRRILVGNVGFTYPFGMDRVCRWCVVTLDGHNQDSLPEETSLAVRSVAETDLPPVVKLPLGRLATRTLHWLSPREIFATRNQGIPPMLPLLCAPGCPVFFRTEDCPELVFVNFIELVKRQKDGAS